jgi:DtxR family Mn-dependent transcriptional regulator
MNSETVEDYLKAIYVLEQKEGRAKTSALARQLGVTAGSVTDMLKRLSAAETKLLTYKHHHGVRLTAEGKRAALDVIRRHRLLETFLHDVLSLNWGEVHAEAEKLEHHLSERVTDALDKLLDYPQFDPHGEPIPTKDGQLPQTTHQKLTDAELKTTLRIVRVNPFRQDLLPYLDSLGIGMHTRVVITEKAPFEGPITLRIVGQPTDSVCRIGRNVADHVFVETG